MLYRALWQRTRTTEKGRRKVALCLTIRRRDKVGTLLSLTVRLSEKRPLHFPCKHFLFYSLHSFSFSLLGLELSKLGGGSLLVIVAVYGFSRLLARRASYFSKVKLASRNEDDELLSRSIEEALDAKKERAGESPKEKKGPKDVFTNAATVGGIFVVLYIISSNLDGYISSLALPEQYTVRQISVTLKTIILGMSYLACFIYGANALGLFLLGVDMVMNPEKHKEEQ